MQGTAPRHASGGDATELATKVKLTERRSWHPRPKKRAAPAASMRRVRSRVYRAKLVTLCERTLRKP